MRRCLAVNLSVDVGSLAVSGDVTAAARVGRISPMSEPPLFRGVVTESLSAGVLHW